MMLFLILATTGLVFLMTGAQASAAMPLLRATDPRCEYLTNPAAIDEPRPRLSWILASDDPAVRDQSQSAYQILVATSREKLSEQNADLWNSGKVASSATNQIVYDGKPLASRQHCWWTVRVWNSAGECSTWNTTATWTMGLLNKSDWTAKWIGYDAPDEGASIAPAVNLQGCNWIWTDEPPAEKKDQAFFRRTIQIAPNRVIRAAHIAIAADDGFELFINNQKTGAGGSHSRAFVFDITNELRNGNNLVTIRVENHAKSPAALAVRAKITFDDGDQIIESDANWQVSRKSFSEEGSPATVIAKVGDEPWGRPETSPLILPPPPFLRKTFTADKPIRRATVYATSLGAYELHLNGRRVGDDYLSPGWTDFSKRVHYFAYDVTAQVQQGENALGAILADGWYAGYLGYTFRRDNYGDKPRLLAQLELEFADGSRQTIATDETWKAAYGPLRQADLLMGCAYDARREISGWDKVGFSDSSWKNVATDEHDLLIQSHPAGPVKQVEELPARSIAEPRPGVYVFDLGQNMVGWCRYRLRVRKGQTLTFRYAEILNSGGLPYTIPLRAARATDYYTAARDGVIEWEPAFTFHGFRYVQIEGLDEQPALDAVRGIVVHTEMRPTGSFDCSDARLNQLVHNIIWGQKGNYLEIPTDCPQRDERLGWTGDAQFFIRTGTYNFDVAAFFTKWLIDLIDDAQMKDGGFTHVAPALERNDGGGTAWQDAAPICVWTIWQKYRDTRIVQHHYAALQRYMDYLAATSKDLVRDEKPFGDWLNLGGGAKGEVIGTAYYAHIAQLMSEMAGAIGKADDARQYSALAARIREKFINEFLSDDGSIKDSSQTAYALAFAMDLLPTNKRQAAAERFVEEIKKKDWHLATGFIGTPRLLPALSAAGRDDVAWRLMMCDTYPSWLFPVTLGATTMWERWDGWLPEKGFQDPGMNSFNHYAFGSVGQWLYETAGGIAPAAPGYTKITLAPRPGGGLSYAKTRYRSISGEIVSSWKKVEGGTQYEFAVPVNTTAEIALPKKPGTIEVGSGTYRFFVAD